MSVHAQLAARSVVKPPQDAAAPLQRKTVPAAGPHRMPDSEERRSGQPLPAQLRDYFQPRLGHDFSGVRVHADDAAASAARTQQARADAVGRDIAIGWVAVGQRGGHVRLKHPDATSSGPDSTATRPV